MPVARSQFSAAFLKAARFWAAWPRKIVQRSSSKVVSRTWCKPFSMAPQWSLAKASRVAALPPHARETEVM